jgi:hypothetical protein
MIHALRITAALALIVGAGLVHGKWTNRWGRSPELAALAARLDTVPMDLGDWKGEAFDLPAVERAAAGVEACLARRYINRARGVSLTVLLLGGLPGDIAVHTPDVCYPGAGYALGTTTSFDTHAGPGGPPAGFKTALATRGGASPSVLRLFWGWNAAGGWAAPEDARWRFAAESALCKLYVVRETAGVAVDPEDDPCQEFLAVFLPELDRRVFSVSP